MLDDRFWMFLGAGVYATALVIALFSLWQRRSEPSRPLILGLIIGGFVLQSIGLQMRGLAVKSCPIGNPFEILQFVSWSIVVVYFITGSVFRMSLLGSFCATLAVLLSVVSFAVPGWDQSRRIDPFGGNPWIEAHATVALFSYGVFGLFAVTSAMYLLQDHGLKHKRFKGLFRYLPPILQLDRVNFRLATVGVGVLTVALLIGSVYWVGNWDNLTQSKLWSTLLLWAAYLLVVLARWSKRLRGARFALFGVVLYIIALLVLWPVEENREREASVDRLQQC